MDEKYLTVTEVSERLRVTRQAVYNWIADGRLRAVKVAGKALRIPLSSVNELVQPVKPGERVEDDEQGQWAPSLMPA